MDRVKNLINVELFTDVLPAYAVLARALIYLASNLGLLTIGGICVIAGAITALFAYRRLHKRPHQWKTALGDMLRVAAETPQFMHVHAAILWAIMLTCHATSMTSSSMVYKKIVMLGYIAMIVYHMAPAAGITLGTKNA